MARSENNQIIAGTCIHGKIGTISALSFYLFSEWTYSITKSLFLLYSESTPYICVLGLSRKRCLSVRWLLYRYRYVSPSGARFEYTSVLLLIQTIINYTIASISMIRVIFMTVVLGITGKENKKFSLQIPKKDLVGRMAIYRVKDKE